MYSKNLLWKVQKLFYLATCILPDYVAHEITKEFWKITILKIWQLLWDHPFFWNANSCRQEGGRGHKLWKFANVLNGWSLSSWGVKTQFGEIPFSGMIIFIFTYNAPLMVLFSPNILCIVSRLYFDYFWGQ